MKGFLAITSALVLCPCHLPLFAAVFAGSALGSAITEHYVLVFWAAALYFTVALFAGVRWLTRGGDQACAPCASTLEHSRSTGGPSVTEALSGESTRS